MGKKPKKPDTHTGARAGGGGGGGGGLDGSYFRFLSLELVTYRKLFLELWVFYNIKSRVVIVIAERDVALWYERSLMVQWVVGSILHGVDPLSYFSFQPELHDWCNKGCGMYYPVCGMVHIKGPLVLIGKSSPCGGSGFPLSLSEWSFAIYL